MPATLTLRTRTHTPPPSLIVATASPLTVRELTQTGNGQRGGGDQPFAAVGQAQPRYPADPGQLAVGQHELGVDVLDRQLARAAAEQVRSGSRH